MSIDITVPFTLGAHSDLGVEDSVLFKGEIKDLRFTEPLKKTWIAAMEKSDLSVFLALLIIKTPKLRWLFLPGGQISTIPFAQLFNRYPSFLSNLEHLWINGDPDLVGFNIASYQNFVTCPNLSTLTFTYGDLDLPSYPSTWKTRKLTAEQVSFYQCHIDSGAIQKFMKACKKLTHFTYESFSLDLEDQQLRPLKVGRELNAENARQGALLHKDTLKLFYLGFARDPWIIEDIEGYQGYLSSRTKIGSLRDFSVLETIYIPHADLPPHPQFPRSLKTLHITDCNSSILGMIQNIAADCKNGLYPNFISFKVLALDITRPIKLPGQRIPPGKTPEECFLGLRDLFKDTTVDFQIVPYNMPDNDDYGIDDEDLEDEGFSGEIPPALEELIMRAALQDPNFPHGFVRGGPNAANDDSWETEDDD
ncbi:hypothetical protein BGW36DRAFT_376282 [Talaromyces proteolyticus]|uniref:F-box domain-containing protein n=1 Tax=Talaromyces proteolyticus TaxID=1131652 RepID=A0AAD4KST1_9EURO|nr:uncharacterized protein BGW36DRAFT_376282 [Talaromyces proteolyticus]KAH8698537.1 hypothetical protein BGW36DRAFT_376282 [Talaromyces proteolyticus]